MTFDLPKRKAEGFPSGRSKVIRGIIAQKEGDPGDEATVIRGTVVHVIERELRTCIIIIQKKKREDALWHTLFTVFYHQLLELVQLEHHTKCNSGVHFHNSAWYIYRDREYDVHRNRLKVRVKRE